jgi:hypothetical protein
VKVCSGDSFACISARLGGMQICTAASLRELITELLLNSGAETAYWAETEAKRCAEIWREAERRDAKIAACNPHEFKEFVCVKCGLEGAKEEE